MKIHLIYLAAGNSRRFGSNKLLYPLNGKPLFQYGLETLVSITERYSNCTLTVVSRYQEILDTVRTLGIPTQYCEESIHGMSYTIRCAIKSINNLSPEDYLVFMVADQPYISDTTITRMLDRIQEKPLIASVCFNERVGNPVMFSAILTEELCNLTGDQGGRAVVRNHPGMCLFIPCNSEQELNDIDTPQEIL